MKNLTFRIILLLLAAGFLASQLCGQKTSPTFGWDLTYSSILKKNNIGQEESIRKWLRMYRHSPAKDWIKKWKGGRIISSILIEYPAFHAGERSTLWLVRTKSHAYYWESIQTDVDSPARIAEHTQKKEVKPPLYDDFFRIAVSWKQGMALKPEVVPDQGIPGYLGFLGLYDKSMTSQMLLNLEDFVVCATKKCEKSGPGRLMDGLTPILFAGDPRLEKLLESTTAH